MARSNGKPDTTITAEHRLESAATQIEQMLAELQTDPKTCPHCGATRYGNFGHHVLLRELGDLPAKLRRSKARLKTTKTSATEPVAKGDER